MSRNKNRSVKSKAAYAEDLKDDLLKLQDDVKILSDSSVFTHVLKEIKDEVKWSSVERQFYNHGATTEKALVFSNLASVNGSTQTRPLPMVLITQQDHSEC